MDNHYNDVYGIPPVYDPDNITGFEAPIYYDGQPTQQLPIDNLHILHETTYCKYTAQPAICTMADSCKALPDQDPFAGHWTPQPSQARGHRRQQSNTSTSAQSYSSFNTRYSSNSIFSHHHGRDSVASTNTTWSQFSAPARESYASNAGPYTNPNVPVLMSAQTQAQQPLDPPPSAPRQDTTKTQYTTCLSRTKRTRRSTRGEPRYFCTSCHEGFREKYDWKRHEETYQERSETYRCDLCKKTYFLEKDFVHHHRESHRCQTCSENAHVELARRKRRSRTGWGCGFCIHFSADWTERCNHIAKHFESGLNMSSWKQTRTILSLLQQPCLKQAWNRLLENKGEANPSFGWSQRWAGRADGYPDSDHPPQLQDLLEFFTPDQHPESLVEWAYEMGHQPRKATDKELPPLPSAAGLVDDGFMPWHQLMSTIPEDEFVATENMDFRIHSYPPQ